VATGQGRLESIASDRHGRLFYTDLTENRLLRLDAPGAQPKVIATEMMRPGGLVFDRDGVLVAGFSGGAFSGVPHNAGAGLFIVDPETGAKTVFARGFDQANGLVRGPDGAFYTSNDIGGGIVRVARDGTWAPWAGSPSPNGLVSNAGQTYLYAAQTFQPAEVTRFAFADPSSPTTFYAAPAEDSTAGPDGLTRDGRDRLYVAANGAGQIWRVAADGSEACVLIRGLTLPSNLAFGGGARGFRASSLYVVTFSGELVELKNATDAPPAPSDPMRPAKRRLRLRVRPTVARVGESTVLHFHVTSRGLPVRGATIRLSQHRVHSGPRGLASVRVRFHRPGVYDAVARRQGYAGVRTQVAAGSY
jgi:gluconolactonase